MSSFVRRHLFFICRWVLFFFLIKIFWHVRIKQSNNKKKVIKIYWQWIKQKLQKALSSFALEQEKWWFSSFFTISRVISKMNEPLSSFQFLIRFFFYSLFLCTFFLLPITTHAVSPCPLPSHIFFFLALMMMHDDALTKFNIFFNHRALFHFCFCSSCGWFKLIFSNTYNAPKYFHGF